MTIFGDSLDFQTVQSFPVGGWNTSEWERETDGYTIG